MSKAKDDLEAVRVVTEAIADFSPEDQKRIIRWALEKVGLKENMIVHAGTASITSSPVMAQVGGQALSNDIRSFVVRKNPQLDTHFAAVVAYYYKFEAPQSERKDAIGADDLQEACRKADRARLSKPIITLGNAHRDGLLDKGSDRGTYAINSVGENLVAIALPSDGSSKPVKIKAKKHSSKKKKSK